MLGLTPLGVAHTAVSLIAVVAGATALVRDKEIALGNRLGRLYVATTVLACLTGFGIFQHGGFGKPHALGILTLLVLGIAAAATRTRWFGRASRYVAAISYSTTFFFHLIPGITETSTRLPIGAPLVTDREGPALQVTAAILFVGLLIGAACQVRWIRGHRDQATVPTTIP